MGQFPGAVDPSPSGLWRAGGTAHPTTSTDNALARYDGTSGALQDSGWILGDSDGMVAATGTLSVGADTDSLHVFGRCALSAVSADSAFFSHIDKDEAGNFALRQTANGSTTLNTAGGRTLTLRVQDAVVATLAAASVTYAQPVTFSLGHQATPEARTATAAGDGTGQVTAGYSVVNITSGSADSVIRLPAAVIGNRVRLYTTANGCELQTPDASNETINDVDCDGANELALAADSVFECECHLATGWIVRGWDNEGADLATLVPDADS